MYLPRRVTELPLRFSQRVLRYRALRMYARTWRWLRMLRLLRFSILKRILASARLEHRTTRPPTDHELAD
jgi:hypothetical protein